jgi:uncharacterized protein (TIGR02611 family)
MIIIAGLALLAVGALLLVLPGPGLVLVVGGLGLLSLEFRWAASLRETAMRRSERVRPKKRSHQVAGMVLLAVAGVAVTVAVAVWGLPF